MSTTTSRDPLDIQTIVAQIKRAQAATRKFAAEQNKLAAEAQKLRRDYLLAPLVILGAVAGGAAAAVATLRAAGAL